MAWFEVLHLPCRSEHRRAESGSFADAGGEVGTRQLEAVKQRSIKSTWYTLYYYHIFLYKGWLNRMEISITYGKA